MNKKYLKISIIIVAILVIVAVSFYLITKSIKNNSATKNQSNQEVVQDIMSDDEKATIGLYHLGVYAVTARNKDGKATAYKLIRLQKEKPIVTPEFMSDEEKDANYLDKSTKIQVLKRDSSGKVLSYKIVKNDSDIVKKY